MRNLNIMGYNCLKCTQNNINNVERLGVLLCVGCNKVPNYIPAKQIKNYIRKKYYAFSNNNRYPCQPI